MHHKNIDFWEHDHIFGQNRRREGERRTLIVIALTASMMIVEIIAGMIYGSMALLADGLHMASHAGALAINAFAYIYARRHARDEKFNFGTGKVNALGGFSGAILLALFAFLMVWESVSRFINPVSIQFNQAISVAILGLVINGVSVFILGVDNHDNDHGSSHSHHHDHNLRSAYLHVMADALTSILAIFALLAAKYFNFIWMDPAMGIVGAVLVGLWSFGLIRNAGSVLLDRQGPDHIRQRIRELVEKDGDSRVTDLHLWSIGPNIYSLELTIVAHEYQSPDIYKEILPEEFGLAHVSIEIYQCPVTREE